VAQLVESGAVAALVRELALQSECVSLEDGERRVVLRVERESLRHPGHAERLQAALAAALGHAVQLEVESGAVDDTPARREAAERARRQREAEALFGAGPAGAAAHRAVQHRPGGARIHQAALKAAERGRGAFAPFVHGTRRTDMLKGQLAGLMKQAQQMQDNLKRAQDELATIEVEGQSGAGLVKVTMTCKHDVKRVTIDPACWPTTRTCSRTWSPRRSTTRCAAPSSEQREKMGKLTAGMPLPPGMKFPF
jgi:DNA-binding YbaB/EbfC family protein